MSMETFHFKLTKPTLDDAADITQLNENFDVIDQKLYALSNEDVKINSVLTSMQTQLKNIPKCTYSDVDLIADESPLGTGEFYFVYESDDVSTVEV